MGANCCTLISSQRDKTLPDGAQLEVSQNRNIRHSSQLFRRDNRTHIEDIMAPSNDSIIVNFNGSEIINVPDSTETLGDNSSADTSSQEAVNTPPQENMEKSSVNSNASSSSKTQSITPPPLPNKSMKTQNLQSNLTNTSPKPKITNSPLSETSKHSDSFNPVTNPWDPDKNHWTCRTFNELVARAQPSPQRANPSFDIIRADMASFLLNDGRNDSTEQHFCRICKKPLHERSCVAAPKISSFNEVTVTSVLICSHAFHPECLEKLTPECDIYNPECPLCMHGEKNVTKMFEMVRKSKNKKSKQDEPILAGKLKNRGSKKSLLKRCHMTLPRSFSPAESSQERD